MSLSPDRNLNEPKDFLIKVKFDFIHGEYIIPDEDIITATFTVFLAGVLQAFPSSIVTLNAPVVEKIVSGGDVCYVSQWLENLTITQAMTIAAKLKELFDNLGNEQEKWQAEVFAYVMVEVAN
ncbi:MAG: hypothetical protein EBQ80_02770 [Proteobacteria bacterium]|nr:hypothetical protein [Pseudomonadota bacterium]